MAEILPFRGIRYNPSHVADFDLVISPPYDVIDADLQAELYRRSPHNIVRIDFGKAKPEDGAKENRYTRAGRLFREWLQQEVLIREAEPAIYYTEEDYRVEGELRTRKGFLATVRIEGPESGLYRPHEKTLAGPKADRLDLTRACRANLSPIFSLYDDPAGVTQAAVEAAAGERRPLLTVRMPDVLTRLWRVVDPDVIRRAAETMKGRSFFIADGHHRYETALAYRDLMRKENPGFTGREPWNYVMMYFANLWAPGLTILPTHRAVFGVPGLDAETFLARAAEHFDVREIRGGVTELKGAMAEGGDRRHRFGVAAGGSGRLWLLELRDEAVMDRVAAAAPAEVRSLDVTVLHTLLLEGMLGIDARAQETQRNLRYYKSSQGLLQALDAGDAQLGFFLNATRVDEVKAVAETGEKMPQKSTFFYPKLVTGLVMNPLFEAEEG